MFALQMTVHFIFSKFARYCKVLCNVLCVVLSMVEQDSLGSMPWRINGRILELMREVQNQDLAIADVPPNTDPPVTASSPLWL